MVKTKKNTRYQKSYLKKKKKKKEKKKRKNPKMHLKNRERERERERERDSKIPILMEVTRSPQALRRSPILLAVTPLPRPLTTPPVTNTYFIFALLSSFHKNPNLMETNNNPL
jgi:hypothetical protein